MSSIKALKDEAAQLNSLKESEMNTLKSNMRYQAEQYFINNKESLIAKVEEEIKKAMAAGDKHTYLPSYSLADTYCKAHNITEYEAQRFFKDSLEDLLIKDLEKKGFNFTYVINRSGFQNWYIHIFWNKPSFIYHSIISLIDDYKLLSGIIVVAIVAAAVLIFK